MNKIRLSALQRQVVNHNSGALLVVAGPGTGKTRVLTERVRRLLTEVPGHFRVLALTFTNKAANEMAERLQDLGDLRKRTFIGTLHGFCLEMLTDRAKPIGVTGQPQIFEHAPDRKQILFEAALADPVLADELRESGDAKKQAKLLDSWLAGISLIKTHPITRGDPDEPIEERVYEAYNAGLRACGAYDFDDLLLLAYRLLSDYPQIADFYRRLYRYICIDEAQDLNEAQYYVLKALCGDGFDNVMMVGDPKQSIYGFATSSPEYMNQFQVEFHAKKVELTENFRSSQAIVRVAKKLEPTYMVEGQLPIKGDVQLIVGQDEDGEAKLLVDEIKRLVIEGHPDIEGKITYSHCAFLGRTRFTLLAIERALKEQEIPFFKRLSSIHEYESDATQEFLLGLRVIANSKDGLHLASLAKKWEQAVPLGKILTTAKEVVTLLEAWASQAGGRSVAVSQALKAILQQSQRLDLMVGLKVLRSYADGLEKEERRAIYEDTTVLSQEWDQYLRAGAGATRTIGGFMSSMALGTTQQPNRDGVALLTVHSSKGLEFEVVFIVGMAEGVFPDYRAEGNRRATEEERRNAFVAITRSKRLLYFSYPQSRMMPWGDVWRQQPSKYLKRVQLVS